MFLFYQPKSEEDECLEVVGCSYGNETGVCEYTEAYDPDDCSDVHHIFEGMYESWSATGAGILILLMALFILCTCLYLIVKLLKSLLQGRVAVWLHATVNGNVPDIRCLRADGSRRPVLAAFLVILLRRGVCRDGTTATT